MSVEVNAESSDPVESSNGQPLPKRPRTQQFAMPLMSEHSPVDMDKLNDSQSSHSNCSYEFESIGPDSQESEVPTATVHSMGGGGDGVDADGQVAMPDSSQGLLMLHDVDEAAGHAQPESEFDSQETLPLDFWCRDSDNNEDNSNNNDNGDDGPGSDSEANESLDSQEYIGPPSPGSWNRFLQHIAAGGEVIDFDWGHGYGPASEVLVPGASPGVYLRLSASVPINSADENFADAADSA